MRGESLLRNKKFESKLMEATKGKDLGCFVTFRTSIEQTGLFRRAKYVAIFLMLGLEKIYLVAVKLSRKYASVKWTIYLVIQNANIMKLNYELCVQL